MTNPISFTINIRGQLLDLSRPVVMGILNVTPDSFFADSRAQEESAIVRRAGQMLAEGATIIDVGACSTRPGSKPVEAGEELCRVRRALSAIRKEFPEAVVSIDTFRADIAACAVEELGADIINDISGGSRDPQMFPTTARLNVPYVLTHCGMQNAELENATSAVLRWLGEQADRLHGMGVKDVIIDPGYGFGKTTEQNFQLLAQQSVLQVLGLPILVGLSRKRMIWQTLGTTPDEALNGTTVLHTLALLQGANILRVHDVREAVETIRLMEAMNET